MRVKNPHGFSLIRNNILWEPANYGYAGEEFVYKTNLVNSLSWEIESEPTVVTILRSNQLVGSFYEKEDRHPMENKCFLYRFVCSSDCNSPYVILIGSTVILIQTMCF